MNTIKPRFAAASLGQLARSRGTARAFTVLALESSADDTCAAVVTSSREILSNVVIKQNSVHQGYGGIHPATAIILHQRAMPYAIQRALNEANIQLTDVDGFAFTRGPGMGSCLAVCASAAKAMAAALHKPVVGVHHMQAHALMAGLTEPEPPQFPFLALLVSGGHSLLVLATTADSYKILATTADESIGRAIDKASRLLEVEWNAYGPGAALEEFCRVSEDEQPLPTVEPLALPFRGKPAFSFAGPHSHLERYVNSRGIDSIDMPTRKALGRAFQTGVFAQLEDKILLGLDWCMEQNISVRDVVVSGGVASNTFLRSRLRTVLADKPVALSFPAAEFCTDNAAMVAWASMHRFLAGDHDQYDIDMQPKWSIEDLGQTSPQNASTADMYNVKRRCS